MSLSTKFEFLKTVKMPTQKQIYDCIIEYMNYKGIIGDAGKYGYFVLYDNQDQKTNENLLNSAFFEKERKKFIEIIKTLVQDDKQINIETDEFVHIKINNSEKVKTECRLYLRILPSNIYRLASLLTIACAQKNIPTHFKFSPSSRIDSIVLYTDYNHVQKFVDIIDEIYQTNPNLFEHSEKIHPLWGNINGYIGFMEEPIIQAKMSEKPSLYLSKSANTYRTKLLDEISKFYKDKSITPTFITTNFLKKFASQLDIDASFLPLNESSVAELEKAGFNILEIGSKANSIFTI